MNETHEDYDSTANYSYTYDEVCIKDEVMKYESVLTPVVFTIIIMFSCVGNTLVLWILIKYENLKSLTNVFLLNLAISDLVFTVGLPFWASDYIKGWTFGEAGCKSVNFIFYLGFYSGLIFLTVMTGHRYMAVVHPLSMTLSSATNCSMWISTCIWFLSFCAAALHVISSIIEVHPEEKEIAYCTFKELTWRLICTYLQNIFFLIAFFTIAFCYIRILMRLLRPMSHTRPKTMKLILCIVITFYLSWTPYNVAIFLDSLIAFGVSKVNECHFSTVVEFVLSTSRLVAFSHCCLNPVFYVFMGVKFREHLKKVLMCFCKDDDNKRHSHLIYSNVEEITMY